MKIALIEPYLTGSHKQWAEDLQKFSSHEIEIFGLTGRNWKWRMQGGAIELAEMFLASSFRPDLFLLTDMLNVPLFLSLVSSKFPKQKTVLYFHENQLAYPWSPGESNTYRDRVTYGFINYSSALVSDKLLFNSNYNKESFLGAAKKMLGNFPDYKGIHNIDILEEKSQIVPVGIDFSTLKQYRSEKSDTPVILWNHRFEYDKNPEDFFRALFELDEEGVPFQLIVLGKKGIRYPKIFDEGRDRLKSRIIHFGYVETAKEYAEYLWLANIQPITSNQDFFGISAVEGLYCNCYPIFPNRLAFPEHFQEDHERYLYNDYDELVNLLRTVITEKRYLNYKSHDSIKRYSWKNLIKQYDQLLL